MWFVVLQHCWPWWPPHIVVSATIVGTAWGSPSKHTCWDGDGAGMCWLEHPWGCPHGNLSPRLWACAPRRWMVMVSPCCWGGIAGAGWERKFAYLVVDHAQEFDECLVVFLTLIGDNQNHNVSYLSITSKIEQFECLNCQILHLREKKIIYIYVLWHALKRGGGIPNKDILGTEELFVMNFQLK